MFIIKAFANREMIDLALRLPVQIYLDFAHRLFTPLRILAIHGAKTTNNQTPWYILLD